MLILTLFMGWSLQAAEVCATKYSELSLSARLETLKPLFNSDKRATLVNETKGSYVVVDAFDDHLTIHFFTSGLFDLYPIRRDGPLKFCDDGSSLRMIGLEREDSAHVENRVLILGDGGAKRSFVTGEMPDLLKRLHKVEPRGLASQPE